MYTVNFPQHDKVKKHIFKFKIFFGFLLIPTMGLFLYQIKIELGSIEPMHYLVAGFVIINYLLVFFLFYFLKVKPGYGTMTVDENELSHHIGKKTYKMEWRDVGKAIENSRGYLCLVSKDSKQVFFVPTELESLGGQERNSFLDFIRSQIQQKSIPFEEQDVYMGASSSLEHIKCKA